MYCGLWLQYIKVQKLFKGGNYSRAETIRGNVVVIYLRFDKQKFLPNFVLFSFKNAQRGR